MGRDQEFPEIAVLFFPAVMLAKRSRYAVNEAEIRRFVQTCPYFALDKINL